MPEVVAVHLQSRKGVHACYVWLHRNTHSHPLALCAGAFRVVTRSLYLLASKPAHQIWLMIISNSDYNSLKLLFSLLCIILLQDDMSSVWKVLCRFSWGYSAAALLSWLTVAKPHHHSRQFDKALHIRPLTKLKMALGSVAYR